MKKIAVVGTIFVDVKGQSFTSVHKDAKNVGKASFSHGGVARNVAQNLAVLGLKTSFLTTVNNDGFGKEVIEVLQKHQVETTYARWHKEDGMGIWVAILDNEGDLVCSISHQPDLGLLEQAVFEQIDKLASDNQAIAFDLDLTYPITEKIIEVGKQRNIPLYGVVGNLDIVKSNRGILKNLTCFVCSEEEASILLGYAVDEVNPAIQAARKLSENGAPLTVITLGAKGSVYYDRQTNRSGHVPAQKAKVIDTTGAGDSFFSGLVAALLQGKSVEDAMQVGTLAALEVIQSHENALTRMPALSLS